MSAASSSPFLPEVLSYCLERNPGDSDGALRDAKTLLGKYAGEEADLVAVLRDRYGPVAAETRDTVHHILFDRSAPKTPLRTKTITTTTTTTAAAASSNVSESQPGYPPETFSAPSVAAVRDPIVSRMRRQRELDAATWRRVYSAAQALLDTLADAQQRVAVQEVEMRRLSAELAAQTANKQNCDAQIDATASTVTRQQLQFLRRRQEEEETKTGRGRDECAARRQRHEALQLLRKEEESLLRVYGRVLLQHVAAFPLSPLREELRRADPELCRLMRIGV